MDSPVHFGQKRRANPDGAINLPRAYFVTLKISLQNFGKSFWRKLKKHRQNKPLPVLSPFTALLSPGSRGSKGVKRVKWGFPDIYEVKSVSRWQGQIVDGFFEGMKWDYGRVNRWGWWFSRTVWNCDHRWLARCRCQHRFCILQLWKLEAGKGQNATVSKVCLPSEGRAEVHENWEDALPGHRGAWHSWTLEPSGFWSTVVSCLRWLHFCNLEIGERSPRCIGSPQGQNISKVTMGALSVFFLWE